MSVSAYVVAVPLGEETAVFWDSRNWGSVKSKLRKFEERFESEIPMFEPFERTLSEILNKQSFWKSCLLPDGTPLIILNKVRCEEICKNLQLNLIKMLFEEFSTDQREKSEEYTFIYWSFRECIKFFEDHPDETIVILMEY